MTRTLGGDSVPHKYRCASKIATVLLGFCLLAPTAAGSCISYGHSCWGAHGKRSGEAVMAAESRKSLQNTEDVFSLLGWMRADEGLTDDWQPRNKHPPDTRLLDNFRESLPTLRWLFQYKMSQAAADNNRIE